MELIKKGAEADLFYDTWYGLQVIRKIRKMKTYRLTQLDRTIRHARTIHEAQIMHEAKHAGVPTPFIYLVDVEGTTIVMQYIDGVRIREVLNSLSLDDQARLCERLGVLIGRLHRYGIVHGDLTTSNMIIAQNNRVFLIDFGLAEFSEELEKRGIDLLLIKRSLQATHYLFSKECFNALLDGYRKTMGKKITKDVVERVEKIAKRGRYAVER